MKMRKLLLLIVALLTLGVSGAWATVSFKADTPYLMIQRQSGKYVNMNALNTNATLSDAWSLIYFTESGGGYVVSDGTNKISAEEWHAYVRANQSNVWTISEVEGVANGYKLYQETSEYPGYFGSDEYNEGKPCFCDKAENHASTTFIIIEANVYVKLLELKTIPALYSSSGINQATTMIIGTALTTSQQESILETIYSSAEGKKFYAVNNNLRGNYMTVGEDNVSLKTTSLTADAIMEVEYAGDGKYYLKGVTSGKYAGAPANPPLTYSSTDDATAFYIGNYAKTTDNKVYFAKTTTNSNDEALHYNNTYTTWVTNWKYSTDPSQWIITAISDDDYETLSSASSETLNYTLTDANGATYSGTITGTLGVNPSFTGCTGYTLSNPTWNISSKTFTANITFPFKVSSNSVNNYTYMSSFNTNKTLCWYAIGDDIGIHYNHAPTNENIWQWQIIPDECTTGAFSFKIKNANGKYISIVTDAQSSSHNIDGIGNTFDTGNVQLKATGTSLTYNNNKWCTPSSNYCLSTFASDRDIDQYLGLYGVNASHNGNKTYTIDVDDFASLISSLETTRNTANTYTIGTRIGEFTEASSGALATALSNADGIINGTVYGTAATITSYKTALETAISGLSLNMPTSGPIFMRIRSSQGAKGYLTAANAGGRATFTQATDASTIYLWGEDKKLVAYGNGLAYAEVYQPQADGANGKVFSVVPAVSGNFGQYSIYSTYSGSVGNVYLYSTGSGNADRNTASDNFKQQNSFTIEAVDELPITFKGQFASFFSPVDLTLADGVKAYTGTLTNNNTILTLTEVDYVPANTGVILEYEGFSSETTLNFPILSTVTPIDDTSLTGSTAAQNVAADSKLVLGKNDEGKWGIYKYSGTTLGGFKAYMDMPETPVKGFAFTFGDADAIANVLNGEQNTNEVYDLSGRQVSKPTRGLYIVNGKKVVVK